MSNKTVIATLICALIATVANCGLCEDKKQFEFIEDKTQLELKLSVYPESVAFGDTCYVLVTAINHSDENARVFEPGFKYLDMDMVQFDLSRCGKTWRGTFECLVYVVHSRISYNSITIPNGKSVTFLAVQLQFPPLEDLYQDVFWEEIRKELKDNPKGLPFEFGIEFSGPYRNFLSNWRPRLTQEVMVNFRNDKEMAMIGQWYRNTPKEFFPKIIGENLILKVPSQDNGLVERLLMPDNRILRRFQAIGNRYPSYPNAPTTWQGWKELEKSITPSTMRDEIRLTRMLIQYCDTKDKKVLDELKAWFDVMNEVQRTVMAKSIRDRAEQTYGEKLLPQFCEIYKTIREYDVVPIPESKEKHLRNLGLLE